MSSPSIDNVSIMLISNGKFPSKEPKLWSFFSLLFVYDFFPATGKLRL